jgi:hypothetical protein
MPNEPLRVGADWLALREPADAAARSPELVEELVRLLPRGALEIHDLGSGTGAMARWLAVRLSGPQHWLLHDRDADLLARAAEEPPRSAYDGAPVTVETRTRDITLLDPTELSRADLIVASALLDTMTSAELGRLVTTCAGVRCPVLITLTVIGHVELRPSDPFDRHIMDAFNAHQRRVTRAGRLLGPDAAAAAFDGFARLGHHVRVRPSPWRLGPDQAELLVEWFSGWIRAACEQRPALREEADAYVGRRLGEAAAGSLSVTVHHQDLLARPVTRVRSGRAPAS